MPLTLKIFLKLIFSLLTRKFTTGSSENTAVSTGLKIQISLGAKIFEVVSFRRKMFRHVI